MADDLGRYLDDEPILARRPSMAEHIQKWIRRNAVLTLSLLAGMTLGLVCLSIAVFLTTSAYRREASQSRAAESQRQRAEGNFLRARQAVDEMLTQVSQQALKVPQADRLRRGLLEKAAEFYRILLEEQVHDPSLSYQTATAYSRLGKLENDLGDLARAVSAYEEQIHLLEAVRSGSCARRGRAESGTRLPGSLVLPIQSQSFQIRGVVIECRNP